MTAGSIKHIYRLPFLLLELQYFLFYGILANKTEHHHILLLTDAVSPSKCLAAMLWWLLTWLLLSLWVSSPLACCSALAMAKVIWYWRKRLIWHPVAV